MKKPTLIMCQGLPASGKSTWAEAERAAGRADVVVTRDDIRRELFGVDGVFSWRIYLFSREQEDRVTAVQDNRIANALASRLTVISADTNISHQARIRLHALATAHDAYFVVKMFFTPPEECIRRDALRDDPVGAEIINKMAKAWGKFDNYEDVVPAQQNPSMPRAVICDLDGTAAVHNGRDPYDEERCDEDRPNSAVLRLLQSYVMVHPVVVFYVTGRHAKVKTKTEDWLRLYQFPQGTLLMRANTDQRKDWRVKSDLFDQHIRNQYAIDFVLDDRDQVVKFWRALGLTCLQVANGAF